MADLSKQLGDFSWSSYLGIDEALTGSNKQDTGPMKSFSSKSGYSESGRSEECLLSWDAKFMVLADPPYG